MNPLKRWKINRHYEANRVKRIIELQDQIHKNFDDIVDLQADDIRISFQTYHESSAHLWNEAISLLTQDMIEDAIELGIDIPDKYFDPDSDPDPDKRILTRIGENWLKREVRQYKMDRVKEWITILMPVLSLVVAILGLLVALKKR
jgi:hypothetical protein